MRVCKKLLALLLAVCLLIVAVPLSASAVTGTEYTIRPNVTDGTVNKFTYSTVQPTWVVSANEAYSEITTSTVNPEQVYAEFYYIGNKVEIWGAKSNLHGKVNFILDDEEPVEFDSYATGRQNDILMYQHEDSDGQDKEHTLKIVATGKTSTGTNRAVAQFSYAKIWHGDYSATDFELPQSIELYERQKKKITPTSITPDYAELTGATYSVENESIATVSESGEVTGVAQGETTLTVDYKEISKTTKIIVKEAVPAISGIIGNTNVRYTQDTYDDILNAPDNSSESLTAWKGDKALSQIAVISENSAVNNVTVKASDFTGNNSAKIAASNVKLYFVGETLAFTGNASGKSGTVLENNKESVPDILFEKSSVDLDFNTVQSIWVEIEVPENTAAGTYHGTITVSSEEVDEDLVFNYTLEVLDEVMPDPSEYIFDVELWQYPYSIAEYYDVDPFSDEHIEILKKHMALYRDLGGHAITCSIVDEAWNGQTYSANEVHYPSMIKWIKQADGTFRYDYNDFDKWVKLNRDLGIGDKIVLYSIASWANQIRYHDESTGKDVTVTLNVGSSEWTTRWTHFLQDLVKHLDEKGWFEYAYMGIDERGFSSIPFDLIESITGRNAKSLKTAGAFDSITNAEKLALSERIDDLSIGSAAAKSNPQAYADLVAQRDKIGKKTTIYTCTGHFPNNFTFSMPGESYWIPFFSASQNADGYMRWAYDAWVEDPLNDTTHSAFEAGDCFQVYPGDETNDNTTRTSIRLEKLAEGVRDINKLKYMQSQMPTLKTDINSLYSKVKTNYGSVNILDAHYANDATQSQLPADMAELKAGVDTITRKFIEAKKNSTNICESLTINNGESVEMQNGSQLTLSVTINPSNLLNKWVNFTSSNESVLTVSEEGVISAHRAGTAIVTASSDCDPTKKDTILVTVTRLTIEESAQVAYYSFNNVTGDSIEDEWNNYDGILKGGKVVDGMVGNALEFSANDQITINNPANLNQSWSISMWVKENPTTSAPVSVMWDGNSYTDSSSESGTTSLDMRMKNGKMGLHVSNGFISVTDPPATDVWNHIVWVNDKSEGVKVYINGQPSNVNNWTKNNDITAPLKVIAGRNFSGSIDEVKIYNRALIQEEINELRKVDGIYVDSDFYEIYAKNTVRLDAELIADVEDNTLIYTSENEKVATVDQTGLVTGISFGDTYIDISNEESGYSTKVFIRVTKTMALHPTIQRYIYPEEDLITVDRQIGQYLGQPDLVMLDDEKTIVTVYPNGHGVGPTILKRSTDGGQTWSERETNLPSSWKDSQETPTIYKLDFTDGSQKLIMITGCPGTWGNRSTGFNTSISNDGGETWSEYEHFFDGTPSIVAMASLIRLKDENGNDIDKWMGVYHNNSYINYKTYLTFDENGNQHWSTPEPYLSQWRSVESSHQICEVGLFRSPDGKRIIGLARSQSHVHLSTMFYSDDEGQTWSKPRELPASLLGERHKAIYDPISGRLFITFREIILDRNNNGVVDSSQDFYAGEWLAWVGTYDDLMSGNEGQYVIEIAKDYAGTTFSGDTGYAGLCVTSDGTIFTNSYGAFDPAYPSNNNYILGARFKLSDIDKALGLEEATNVSALREKLNSAREALKGNYNEEKLAALNKAVKDYTEYLNNPGAVSQEYVDNAVSELDSLLNSLGALGDVNADNKIDATDATLVLQKYAGIIGEDSENFYPDLADVDGKDGINSTDATFILQKYSGIITLFPLEE